MHTVVEALLSRISVRGQSVPYAHIRYTGKAKLYITYQFIDEEPVLCSSDKPDVSAVKLDVDIFSKSNGDLIAARNELITAFIGADWIWSDLSPEMYEDDTGYIHRTLTFEKERMI